MIPRGWYIKVEIGWSRRTINANIPCSMFKVRGEIAHKCRKSGFDRSQRATDRGSVRCDGA